MGMTYVEAKIYNPARPQKGKRGHFLVDSGAIYSVVPTEDLKQLGIKPYAKERFTLANGEVIEREIGDAIFEIYQKKGASRVIFGQRGDSSLLGTLTLESLGFFLDPLQRKLRPLPMLLA
jgi:clan AA aspartic protease